MNDPRATRTNLPPTKLSYSDESRAIVRKMTFEAWPDGCRLTWLLAPSWLIWTSVATSLAAGTMNFLLVVWVMNTFASLAAAFPAGAGSFPTPAGVIWGFALRILSGLIWVGFAIYQVIDHRRFGHVAQMLEAGRDGVTYRRRKLFGVRYRRWDSNEIRRVHIRSLRSIIPGDNAAMLYIEFSRRRKLRFRLNSAEQVRFGQRFADGATALLHAAP